MMPEPDSSDALFDSLSQRWIKVDNFAFNKEGNHFSEDFSKGKDFEEESSSVLLLDAETLEQNAFQVAPGDEDFERLFTREVLEDEELLRTQQQQHRPKIINESGDGHHQSRPLVQRRLSDELMPSITPRLPPPTPSTASEQSSLSSTGRFTKNTATRRKSSIPRYVRNARAKSFSPAPKVKSSPSPPPALDRQRSRSATNLIQADIGANRENSRSDGSLNLFGGGTPVRRSSSSLSKRTKPKADYGHVQSKVKAYIAEVKNLPTNRRCQSQKMSPNDSSLLQSKSQSLSNLLVDKSFANSRSASPFSKSQSNLSRMKAFISTSHLEDLQTTVGRLRDAASASETCLDKLDRSRITRLLDNLSDDDDGSVVLQPEVEEEELAIEVEDVLLLALEERKEKKQTEKVLSQLQSNYDMLQKKYAEAENKIDRLRFNAEKPSSNNNSNNNHGHNSLAVSDNTSLLVPSSYMDNISTLLFDNRMAVMSEAGSCASLRTLKKANNNNNHIMEMKAFQVDARARLTELQEQLFGLELLTEDFSSMEKLAAMEEVKKLFEEILQETTVITGHPDPTSLSPRITGFDPDFIDLLKSVGKKLYDLELEKNTKMIAVQQQRQRSHLTTASAMDPIEKVEQWQTKERQQQQQQPVSLNTAGGATSCYGSLPASPSPDCLVGPPVNTSTPHKVTASVPPLQLPSHISSSPIPGELDSGYPGSDRSALRLQFSSHKQGSTSSSHSGRQWQSRQLSNVEETEERGGGHHPVAVAPKLSSTSEEEDIDDEDDSPIRIATSQPETGGVHRTYLNSVTDLSSDERSMFEAKADTDHYSIVPEKYQKPSPRHPMILAGQIDKEIMELRNFFDDHREEMMTLIHDNSQELVFPPVPVSTPIIARQKQQPRGPIRTEHHLHPGGDDDSGTDREMEHRRRSFELRRRAKKKKEIITVTPEFHLGPNMEPSPGRVQQPPGISAFFPAVQAAAPPQPSTVTPRSHRAEAPHPPSSNNNIFIPKLALDDLWTDDERRQRDPRSFDFNQSFVSVQSSNLPSEDIVKAIVEQQRPKTDCRLGAPDEDIVDAAVQAANKLRSRSVADLQHIGGSSTPNVVIVQTCCRHHSCESGRRASMDAEVATTPKTATGSATGREKSKRSKSSKSKSRAKKEMKALLLTLEQANLMAKTLRERSKDIVQVLDEELNHSAREKKNKKAAEEQ